MWGYIFFLLFPPFLLLDVDLLPPAFYLKTSIRKTWIKDAGGQNKVCFTIKIVRKDQYQLSSKRGRVIYQILLSLTKPHIYLLYGHF